MPVPMSKKPLNRHRLNQTTARRGFHFWKFLAIDKVFIKAHVRGDVHVAMVFQVPTRCAVKH